MATAAHLRILVITGLILGISGVTFAQSPGAILAPCGDADSAVDPTGKFMLISGVYDQFNPIDFDSHVLSGPALFSWLVKVDINTGVAAWATKVHAGSGSVAVLGTGGPWVVANHSTGDIYASVCAEGGVGTVVSFFQAGSMTPVATRTGTNGGHVYLVKYNKNGVLQWVRHTFYTVTNGPPDQLKFMSANMPNLCMLPSGNVVLSASVLVGNSGLADATTVKWSDGTNSVDAEFLGEDGSIQGVLLEIDPNGTFISAKASESEGGIAGGGGPNTPITLSPAATNGFAAGHLRNLRASLRFGRGEANEFAPPALSVDSNTDAHVAKYDAGKQFQWAADTRSMQAGSHGVNTEPASCAVDSAGAVYTTDILYHQTSQLDLHAEVNSAGFMPPTTSVFIGDNASGHNHGGGAPLYTKRSDAGVVLWSKTFGPSSTYGAYNFGRENPHPITITSMCNGPWIAGSVRPDTTEHLYLDEGLASEVQILGDTPPYPRAFLAELNPVDGTVVQLIMFNGEAGLPCFGVSTGWAGDIRRMDAIFRLQPLSRTKLGVILDKADTRLTIDGTNLDPIAPGKSFAPFAIIDVQTGAVLIKKRYPTSMQERQSTVRAVCVTSAGQ